MDEMQLRAAALKVLPSSVNLAEVAPCRNPDSAHARISTTRIATSEGVQQWYELTCSREAQPWRCDPPQFKKTFQTHLMVQGSSHEVELAFDGKLSLNRALKLANVALGAFRPDEGLSFCGDKESHEPDKKDLWSHAPMPQGKVSIEVSLNKERATQTVWLEDPDITMDFPIPANEELQPVATCWNVEIVVA